MSNLKLELLSVAGIIIGLLLSLQSLFIWLAAERRAAYLRPTVPALTVLRPQAALFPPLAFAEQRRLAQNVLADDARLIRSGTTLPAGIQ